MESSPSFFVPTSQSKVQLDTRRLNDDSSISTCTSSSIEIDLIQSAALSLPHRFHISVSRSHQSSSIPRAMKVGDIAAFHHFPSISHTTSSRRKDEERAKIGEKGNALKRRSMSGSGWLGILGRNSDERATASFMEKGNGNGNGNGRKTVEDVSDFASTPVSPSFLVKLSPLKSSRSPLSSSHSQARFLSGRLVACRYPCPLPHRLPPPTPAKYCPAQNPSPFPQSHPIPCLRSDPSGRWPVKSQRRRITRSTARSVKSCQRQRRHQVWSQGSRRDRASSCHSLAPSFGKGRAGRAPRPAVARRPVRI